MLRRAQLPAASSVYALLPMALVEILGVLAAVAVVKPSFFFSGVNVCVKVTEFQEFTDSAAVNAAYEIAATV